MFSYSDLIEHIAWDPKYGTREGAFYPGLYTAVTNDENEAYNGPYYISYEVTEDGENTRIEYSATKLATFDEIEKQRGEVEEEVFDMAFGWGHL